MKTIYKIIIFLAVFELTAILVNGMNIFPAESTFFSDINSEEVREAGNNPLDVYLTLFKPSGFEVAGFSFSSASFTAILIVILTFGTGVAILTKSFVPAVLALQGIILLPMITRSGGFFRKLFENFDSTALTYLGVTIIVGFLIVLLITIIETPTHGRS